MCIRDRYMGALGAMLYKMCFCLYPFEKGDLRARVEKGDYMLKGNILATVNSLEIIAKCLLRDSEKRPTTKELLKENLVTKSLEDLRLVWIKKDMKLNINTGRETLKDYLASADYCYFINPVSYTHLRTHETPEHLVCRLLL
eukprot:TRINITY_DN19145_c0_g1_i3.p1 TRINITY_DN19145_c0_g1~~TRINITY_DN19145_c0_g1_i3.p1  ORF type:complete len:142 (-),score=33.61 TRINITY_DN19145_c0_g1_i3:6-431(-)